MNNFGWALIASALLMFLVALSLSAELFVPRCVICGKPLEGNDDEIDRLLDSPDWRVASPLFYHIPLVHCTRCWRSHR